MSATEECGCEESRAAHARAVRLADEVRLLRKVKTAAVALVARGHHDTCGSALTLGEFPCSCGVDALAEALKP